MGCWDVVVVGGGPAGCILATQIAHEGFAVLLLDNRPRIGQGKVCTGIIGEEAYRTWNLPRAPILASIRDVRFVSPYETSFIYRHPTTLAYVVARDRFDAALAERAISAGAAIRTAHWVTRIEPTPRGMTLTGHVGTDRQPFRLHARLVVLATGVHYRLHSQVGLGRPRDFLRAAQAHVPVQRPLDMTTCWIGRRYAPGAFAWMVPISNGIIRTGLMAETSARPFFQRMLDILDARHGVAFRRVAVDFKPIAQGWKGPIVQDHVIAIGEAAGQVKTTTGGGIYYGMVGAHTAVEHIIPALRADRLRREHLQEYERAIRRRLGPEILAGYTLRKMFARLSDDQIERIFEHVQQDGFLRMIRMHAHFDWHLDLLRTVLQFRWIRLLLGL